MSSEVGIRELQQHASDVVRRAAAGESITVTLRGRPVAVLSPLRQEGLAHLLEVGAARAATVKPWDPPEPEPSEQFRLTELLAESREYER